MTAEDIVASMEYARENSSYTNTYSTFWEKLEIKDDYTVIVTTKEVYAKTLIDLSSHYVLPKELVEQGNDAVAANPIGTGPYAAEKFTEHVGMTVVRNEHYWNGEVPYASIELLYMGDASAKAMALRAHA